jgi:hypothetical protein
MLRDVLTVAFHDPFQPIFDFESAHAAKYARRIGHFPARNAALFKLTPTTQAAVVGVSLKNYRKIKGIGWLARYWPVSTLGERDETKLGPDNGAFFFQAPDAAQHGFTSRVHSTLHGVVFAIFVQALPCTAEATLCRVRDTTSLVPRDFPAPPHDAENALPDCGLADNELRDASGHRNCNTSCEAQSRRRRSRLSLRTRSGACLVAMSMIDLANLSAGRTCRGR